MLTFVILYIWPYVRFMNSRIISELSMRGQADDL
jgi:hypothetical protein